MAGNHAARGRSPWTTGAPATALFAGGAATCVLQSDAGGLARADLVPADVDRFACHRGGTKVITALERALSLDQGALDDERAVLTECGNLSAPAVLFVQKRLVAKGLPQRTLPTAQGQGFTASCVSLRAAA